MKTIIVSGTNFAPDATLFGFEGVTKYVNSSTLEILLSPGVVSLFATSGKSYNEGAYKTWVVQRSSDISNEGVLTISNPVPFLSTVTAVLNNTAQPCRVNLSCQLVLGGSGFVGSSRYQVVETGTILNTLRDAPSPMPWTTATTVVFSVSTPGTYTVRVSNASQPNGGLAVAEKTFSVAP